MFDLTSYGVWALEGTEARRKVISGELRDSASSIRLSPKIRVTARMQLDRSFAPRSTR